MLRQYSGNLGERQPYFESRDIAVLNQENSSKATIRIYSDAARYATIKLLMDQCNFAVTTTMAIHINK